MYIPSNHIDENDNDRVVFDTDIMELIDAFRLTDDVFDYRFMFEYNERGNNRMVTSYHKRMFMDKRWQDMIEAFNEYIVDMYARIITYNNHSHIVINDRIVTLYGKDEIHIGYDGAIHDFVSYIKGTDIEALYGADILDAESAVIAINHFVNVMSSIDD